MGFIISAGCFGEGLQIEHYGSIIVNPKARVGKNCKIHGNCCIGSTGGYPDYSPVIGDNVDIGQGAQILGGIRIADNVKIGAGAVVVKDVLTPGVTVVGIPGHIARVHGEKLDHTHTPDPIQLEIDALRQRIEELEAAVGKK